MGLFNSRNTRNEREAEDLDPADVAGEKAAENIEEDSSGRGPGRILLDGFLNMRDYAVDTVMGKIERAQENRRIYQQEYRKQEKKALKEKARKDAFGEGQDNSQGFLQNLAQGLQNTGNAFAQPPPEEERSERSSRRRGEKSEDRRRDDWGQLW